MYKLSKPKINDPKHFDWYLKKYFYKLICDLKGSPEEPEYDEKNIWSIYVKYTKKNK